MAALFHILEREPYKFTYNVEVTRFFGPDEHTFRAAAQVFMFTYLIHISSAKCVNNPVPDGRAEIERPVRDRPLPYQMNISLRVG